MSIEHLTEEINRIHKQQSDMWRNKLKTSQKKRQQLQDEIQSIKIANSQKCDLLYEILYQECAKKEGTKTIIDNGCLSIYEELCESMVSWGRLKRRNARIYIPIK